MLEIHPVEVLAPKKHWVQNLLFPALHKFSRVCPQANQQDQERDSDSVQVYPYGNYVRSILCLEPIFVPFALVLSNFIDNPIRQNIVQIATTFRRKAEYLSAVDHWKQMAVSNDQYHALIDGGGLTGEFGYPLYPEPLQVANCLTYSDHRTSTLVH